MHTVLKLLGFTCEALFVRKLVRDADQSLHTGPSVDWKQSLFLESAQLIVHGVVGFYYTTV
jgi:hypothetical protein